MRVLCLTLAAVVGAALLSRHVGQIWVEPFLTLTGHWRPEVAALDFNIFYSAADRIVAGDAASMYAPAALSPMQHAHGLGAVADGHTLPYLNPPFFALLIAPLAALPFPLAFGIWTALNAALLGVILWIVWRSTSQIPVPWRLSLVIVTMTALPVALTFQLGQFLLLLAASWMGAYRFFRLGRDEWAGLALAPLLIKPELLVPVVIVLIWQRRLRAFRALAPAAAALMLVSAGVVGVRAGIDYPLYLYHNASQHLPGTETDIMFGWNGVLDGAFHVRGGLETLLAIPIAAATLYAAARCWKQPPAPGTDGFADRWLVLTMATLLIDPHLYFQDLTLLVPVACVFVAASPAGERRVAAIALAAGWCILLFGPTPNRSWGINLFGVFLAASFTVIVVRTLLARQPQGAANDREESPHPRLSLGEQYDAA